MKKAFQICFIAAFMLILVIPAIFINTKPGQISEIDNRYLCELPHMSSPNFTEEVESYLTDRVFGRNKMIELYTNANNALFNIMSHPNYQYGTDGYVYQRLDQRPTDEYVDKFNNVIGMMNKYCEERGTQFIFMLNPAKASVYPDNTPRGMHLKYDSSRRIIDYLDENGIDYYCPKDDLIKANEDFPTFNRKFDAGHWNNDGALFACVNLIKHMRERSPGIVPVSKDKFKRSVTVMKTLKNSSFIINEDYATYEIIDSKTGESTNPDDYADRSFKSCLTYDSRHSTVKYYPNDSAKDAPTMMIFKGSYFDALRFQFLIPSFSGSYWVQSYYNIQRFDYFYNVFKPDIVIFEVAEYAVLPTFFPEEQLESAAANPLISEFDSIPCEDFASIPSPIAEFENFSETARNTEDAAITFNYAVGGEPCKYAYMDIDGEIFDFEISGGENGTQNLLLTVRTEKAAEAKSASIILISGDEKKKCIIELHK